MALTALRRASRTAPEPLWHQIVEQFPAPIAVASMGGSVLAMNRALRTAVREDGVEQLFAPAIQCASAARIPVICCCPIVPGYCFECRKVDDEGDLVALIGRATQA